MARLKIKSDEELKAHLHYELKFNHDRIRQLDVEWSVLDNVYQAIIGRDSSGGYDATSAIREVFHRNLQTAGKPVLNSISLARAMMFIHSKLCITEPAVVTRPFRRDYPTIKAAEICQLWAEHIRETTGMQEILESGPYLNVATKGMGVIFIGWDADRGEPMGTIQPDGSFLMSGDFTIRSVSPRNFYIDSTAKSFKDAECCIEVVEMSASNFDYQFQRPELLAKILDRDDTHHKTSGEKLKSNNSVKVYYYWEKALPWNGLLGSLVIFTTVGEDIGDIEILHRGEHPYPHKQLPFAIMTDLDIDENPYGMGRGVHCAHHIDIINLFMSLIIENIEINGIPRVFAPEGSVDDGLQIADIAKVVHYNPASGGQVYHLKPAPITTDVWRLVDIMKEEIDQMYGQGEFSKGEIPRELSSYAVQFSVEMDDKFRIRLFNKKRNFLKTIYTQALSLAQHFCIEPRKLQVSGFKNKYKNEYFSAEDLAGDYGIFFEQGKYMPIDPSARKQMVLEMVNSGAYERAGGNPKKLFKILLDGDMFDLTEVFENAVEVQNSEIVDIINGTREVEVQPWHEHSAHMEALQDLFSEPYFEELPKEAKEKLWMHYIQHENIFAEQAANAQQAEGGEGGGQLPEGDMAQPQNIASPDVGGQGMIPPDGSGMMQ